MRERNPRTPRMPAPSPVSSQEARSKSGSSQDRRSGSEEAALWEREWLQANGTSGYASSTILMCPTRRYHGWLVAPGPDGHKRHVYLSRFEENLHLRGRSFPISVARFPGTWSPCGHQFFREFHLRPYPRSVYSFGNVSLTRELLLVRGEPVVCLRYRVCEEKSASKPENASQFADGYREFELDLRPLLAFREADRLTVENAVLNNHAEVVADGVRCQPYGSLPQMFISVVAGGQRFIPEPLWYRNLEYSADLERGYEGTEDQASPGLFRAAFSAQGEILVAASLHRPVRDLADLWQKEESAQYARWKTCISRPGGVHDFSADSFLYQDSESRKGVLAGFPWFGEWGRDTFIALPGLTLARGEADACKHVLDGAERFLSDAGLLPNIYGAEKADSHYGSVDAALWFARAVDLYSTATQGNSLRNENSYLPALETIAEGYLKGIPELHLEVRKDGLLSAGGPSLNLTWMDAQIEKGPVTPRHGCAVEINALWYALLAQLEQLHAQAGNSKQVRRWQNLRRKLKRSFLREFWLEDGQYLADTITDGQAQRAVRPNMVIAASLEHSPLTRRQRAAVIEMATRELLTPKGLRTLSPRHPDYIGSYRGGSEERDSAYHQGTVWPWLLGFYCEAAWRAGPDRKRHRDRLLALWQELDADTSEGGLNHISEVYDGDSPHGAGGSFAQAWNTAEYLRTFQLLRSQAP